MDVETASFWYERQRQGLGLEFLNCVENSLAKIQRYPESSPKVRQELRRVLLKRFPYSWFYLFKKNCIYVVSVFDNRQDPRKLP
jgi:plasmid stabilization system protein ParE